MIDVRWIVLVVALLGGGPSVAAPAPEAPAQPGLVALVASRDAAVRDSGIQQIVARTGKAKRDIQVLTLYGPLYFAWPKNVAPVPFELYFNAGGDTAGFAHDFTDATRPTFSAALDAILPQAMRGAASARAHAQRPRN